MDGLAWCRERLLVPGQPLAASLLFALPEDRDAILAVRSLALELLQLLEGPPEPALLNARLGWWQGALTGQHEHPALAALAEVGKEPGARAIEAGVFAPLLLNVTRAAEPVRFEQFEELWQRCRSLGGQGAAVETGLYPASDRAAEAALELGAAGFLLKRVRDIALDARHHRWIVPLDLQAQFQVARQDVLEARGGPGWDGLVRTLVTRAVRSGDAAAASLDPAHRHLSIHWAVEKRLAAALAGRPARILQQRLLPGHAGNVWAAWRAARRISVVR